MKSSIPQNLYQQLSLLGGLSSRLLMATLFGHGVASGEHYHIILGSLSQAMQRSIVAFLLQILSCDCADAITSRGLMKKRMSKE